MTGSVGPRGYLDVFRQSVARTPDAVAVRTLDGAETTYAELDARTDRVAAALDEQVPGGRVGTLLDGRPPAVDALLAAGKRGRAVVPLNVRESPGTLAFMLDDADARALVFDAANAGTAEQVLDRVDLDVALAVGDASVDVAGVEVTSYEAAVADAAERDSGDWSGGADGGYSGETEGSSPDAATAGEFAVFYTSGSTGRPKGVPTDGERLRYATSQTVMEMGLSPGDTALVVTPLFHLVTAESWVLPHFQAGATVVLQPHFDPEAAVGAVEDHGVTQVLAVPPQLDALVDAVRAGAGDVATLQRVRTGGGPLHESTVDAVHEHLAPAVHNTYGLTEAVSNVTHAYPEWQREAPGTVGRASFNWEVRVVEAVGPDETPDPAATVGRGGSGEVLVRGPTTADGYLDRPEAEADLFVGASDGGAWVRTGDVAEVDAAGYLHVVDRVDNMLVTGGENVYPKEVESVLEAHPDVREAAVVGVPDDTWGTAVATVVVGDATAEDLEAFCRGHERLADFKRPRRYEFADELPRSPLGKLRREEIRARHFP